MRVNTKAQSENAWKFSSKIQLAVIKIFMYQGQVFPKGSYLHITQTLGEGHSRIYSINCFNIAVFPT